MEPHFLKGRSGHHAPPSKIRFYGENGKHLLSAGRDQSLRSFSIVRDSQSVELSQGSIDKKAKQRKVTRGELMLPVVTDFAACKRPSSYHVLVAHAFLLNSNNQRKAVGQYRHLSCER